MENCLWFFTASDLKVFCMLNFYFSVYSYFLICVEIQDPCRPGVKQAVELCQKAGVKVFLKIDFESYLVSH